MRLNPAARLPDETKEIYALRRWTENRMIRLHLRGSPLKPQLEKTVSQRRRDWRKSIHITHRQCKKYYVYAGIS